MMPTNGYAKKTKQAMLNTTRTGIGVDFGRFCLEMGYSIREVAEAFKVTKPTVYSWFLGEFTPRPPVADKMRSLMQALNGSKDEPSSETSTANE